MKSIFRHVAIWFGAFLILTPAALAWDLDFHFLMTYLICRDSGINHNLCLKAAKGAEWTDQSLISGPFF